MVFPVFDRNICSIYLYCGEDEVVKRPFFNLIVAVISRLARELSPALFAKGCYRVRDGYLTVVEPEPRRRDNPCTFSNGLLKYAKYIAKDFVFAGGYFPW